MKHRVIISGFLCFVAFLIVYCIFLFKSVLGEEIKHQKIIVLCFDDGPRPWILKKLLPVLEEYNVPATFFVMGWAVAENKKIIKKMHDAGHEVENHSFGHEDLKILYKEKGAEAVKKTIKRAGDVIFETTGRHPRFFRPRSWDITEEIEKIIIAEGYTVMKLDKPDINTEDYLDFEKRHPPEILIKRVKYFVADREKHKNFNHVLVFHELPITAEALKTLIPYFQTQGYKFIRLDEYF